MQTNLTNITFTKGVGLRYGEGSINYGEYVYHRTERGRTLRYYCYLVFRFRKNNENKVKKAFTNSFALGPLKKTKTFAYGISSAKERETINSFLDRDGNGNKLRNPLLDGICLICKEINPFFHEEDHVFGRKNSDFVITLCSNCHRLKTNGWFKILENRLT